MITVLMIAAVMCWIAVVYFIIDTVLLTIKIRQLDKLIAMRGGNHG